MIIGLNLQTIPSVKERSVTSILSVIGVDMKMFLTTSALGAHRTGVNLEKTGHRVKKRRVCIKMSFSKKSLLLQVFVAGMHV